MRPHYWRHLWFEITHFWRAVKRLNERQKRHLIEELTQVRGLIPLLMKPRNQLRWTKEEKAELLIQLRRLSDLSPYFLILLLPGSVLLLPLYAWWLDRRITKRAEALVPKQMLLEQNSPSPSFAENKAD